MQDNLIRLNDADKAVDFTTAIQGHVSQNIKQVFKLERTRIRRSVKAHIEAAEHIVKDQFGNLYVVFVAKLMDGEVYSCTAWIGSYRWTGTQKTLVLVKEYRQFRRFSDDLLGYLQDQAFFTFGKVNLGYLKGRSASKLAVLPGTLVPLNN